MPGLQALRGEIGGHEHSAREALERCRRTLQRLKAGIDHPSAPHGPNCRRALSPLPETISTFRFDPKALRDVTPRQRSIYQGVICLILGSGMGARDFHTQAVITGKLMAEQGIDDHHVFPSKYLETKKDIKPARQRDCVLNRTLIDRTTNQMISDRAPSDYLAQIRDTPGFPFDAVLISHSLPTGQDSPFWTDDYEAFLTWRQSRLWDEIKRATGLTEAADLELGD
jgi:hypothetical protein